jgi:integrase
MGVKVREKPPGSGVWWIFIDHNGKRKAKKVGCDKKLALEAAKKIEAKLTLGIFSSTRMKSPKHQRSRNTSLDGRTNKAGSIWVGLTNKRRSGAKDPHGETTRFYSTSTFFPNWATIAWKK